MDVDVAGNSVVLSKIFEWYGKDFAPDMLTWVQARLPAAQAGALASLSSPTVTFAPYDWSTNFPKV